MSNQTPQDPHFTNQPIPPHLQQHNVVGGSPLAPKPPKKRHTLRTVLIIIGGLFALLIVVAVLTPGSPQSSQTPPAAVQTADNGPSPDPVVTPKTQYTPPPAPKYGTPVAKDFKLTVKTLTKQCFGSAGCNVTYRILVAYSGPDLDPSKSYDVLYTVRGGEDVVQNKLTVEDGQSSVDEEEMVSTKTSKAKLTAVATDVLAS